MSLLTITKIELNSVLIMGSLDNNNFIIKFNNTELHALSKPYNSYSFLHRRCLAFLAY